MCSKTSNGRVALAAALCLLSVELGSASAVCASEELKYPDLRGEWVGTGGNRWPVGVAPLTPEYQAIFDANTRDQLSGGQGDTPTVTCLPPGMPRQMNVYEPMEIIVTPQTTHMLVEHVHDSRRIYTDGRAWPAELEPSFRGTSIGTWSDADGD